MAHRLGSFVKKAGYRYYRFLWDYAPYLPVRRLPVHLDLEVTSRCNLRCVMCPHGEAEKNFALGDMPMEKALVLLKEGRGAIKSVKFNWRGEPTLYKGLPELISCAKKYGYIETMINTNLNCRKEVLKDIVKAGLDKIIVSIDSFDKTLYPKIRVGGNLELVLDNLDYVKSLKGSENPELSIVVQARRQKLNEGEVFPEGVKVKSATQRTQEGAYVCGAETSVGRKDCLMPLRRLLVSWDGYVYGCCADWYGLNSIGEIKGGDASLSFIWLGEKAKKLRRALRDKEAFKQEPCKSCFSRESYIWKR